MPKNLPGDKKISGLGAWIVNLYGIELLTILLYISSTTQA